MSESIVAIVTAIVTVIARELITKTMSKRKKNSETPFSIQYCKDCFFFKEFKRRVGRITDSDTTIIKFYRDEK